MLLPSLSAAEDEILLSTTFLSARQSVDENNHLTAYEFLDLSLDAPGTVNLSLRAGGWVRGDILDDTLGDSFAGSLRYSYLEYSPGSAEGILSRLGRQRVVEGVADELLDGLWVKGGLPAGLTLSGYLGAPVVGDGAEEAGEIAYGARLGHAFRDLASLGVSYVRESTDGEATREEGGVDLLLLPLPGVRIAGRSAYNVVEEGWMEHEVTLFLRPAAGLTIDGRFSWADYAMLFASETAAPFAFDSLDLLEQRTAIGGGISIVFPTGLAVRGHYTGYEYDLAGSAAVFGGEVDYLPPGRLGAGAAVRRASGDDERLRYTGFAVYGQGNFGPIDATIDADTVSYDSAVNGVSFAYAVTASLGYRFGPASSVTVDTSYSHDPDFESDVRAGVRLDLGFGGSSTGKGAPRP